ncbi:type III endosome membrane protein TEMP [Lepisosteus oculatus]|uniref:type III endosome membrane protein TEMP n=1 Tax=Lepisosteus oculatus TaxID=7918 RepID=UPI00073FDDA7|nr:PREDICTED: type III endosome membrane protein TEMP [Lepisosteus oculatus]
MGTLNCTLGVVVCLWGTVIAVTQAVSLCVGIGEILNCSQKRLTQIPPEIWDNVTVLDLSGNFLDLTETRNQKQLERFQSLVFLNLTGNYLPLLERKTFNSLQNLQVLDLSSCHIKQIKAGAFQGFPKLKSLLLRNNKLWGSLTTAIQDLTVLSFLDLHGNRLDKPQPSSLEWLKGVGNVIWPSGSDDMILKPENNSEENEIHHTTWRSGQRKLLEATVDKYNTTANFNNTSKDDGKSGNSWQYLIAVLVTAISLSVFIALVVKCKLCHDYLASYRHTLLSETDTASRCDTESLEAGLAGRGPQSSASCELEDDDGFIEDNYIQASERERAERQGEEEEEENRDDEIQFSIT